MSLNKKAPYGKPWRNGKIASSNPRVEVRRCNRYIYKCGLSLRELLFISTNLLIDGMVY